jgi:hypothetical protein
MPDVGEDRRWIAILGALTVCAGKAGGLVLESAAQGPPRRTDPEELLELLTPDGAVLAWEESLDAQRIGAPEDQCATSSLSRIIMTPNAPAISVTASNRRPCSAVGHRPDAGQ